MKKNIFSTIIVTFFYSSNLFCQIDRLPSKLFRNVINKPQKNENWCFAATTQTVFNYFGINYTQEKIVCDLQRLTNSDTINCGSKPHRDMGFYDLLPFEKKTNWINYFIENGFKNAKLVSLSEDSLIKQIKNGPIISLFGLDKQLTHAMIIINVIKIENNNSVFKGDYILHVLNPAAVCIGCTYLMLWNVEKNRIVPLNNNNMYSLNFDGKPIEMLALGNHDFNQINQGISYIKLNDVTISKPNGPSKNESNPDPCLLAYSKVLANSILAPDSLQTLLKELNSIGWYRTNNPVEFLSQNFKFKKPDKLFYRRLKAFK